LWSVAAFTALLTAFYMFRLLWLTFLGTSRVDHDVAHHIHESPASMTSVLVILAVLSAIGGVLALPHFLEPQLALPSVSEELHHLETPLVIVSVALALLGLAGAAYVFGGPLSRAEALRVRFGGVHRLLTAKYYVDELYDRVLAKPLFWISEHVFLRFGDRTVLDGTLNGLASLGQQVAGVLSRVQSGSLHRYALFVMVGVVSALLWSWAHA